MLRGDMSHQYISNAIKFNIICMVNFLRFSLCVWYTLNLKYENSLPYFVIAGII